jgi:ABC-type antimicrobial peptide transport system permease subunit
MIKNYLITAWRNISRNKVYTAINVLGLTIGISACLIIYLITSFELGFDTFQKDKDRIYRIVTHLQTPEGTNNEIAGSISVLPIQARKEIHGFESVTAFYNYFAKTTIPLTNNAVKKFDAPKEGEQKSPVIVAEPQYFTIFKYQWLQGNPATALNEPFKVVLSEDEAHKYFGQMPLEDVIGKEVIYNDSLRVNVSGIVKDWDKNTDFNFKDIISFATIQSSFIKNDIDLNSWGMWNFNSQGFIKLGKTTTVAQIEKQFQSFFKLHASIPPGMKVKLGLQPLSDIHFNSNFSDAYSRQAHLPTLYGLMAIAAFILIIAAINFINLSTAQSLRRAKEVGVRKVLGSSKANLTIQFLAETLIVTLVAVIIAVLITNPVISAFQSIIPQGAVLNVFSPSVLLFLVSITFITAFLAGFYPARVLSSYLPALSLKGQGPQQLNSKGYFRKILIVFQFTVSLVFIIGTLIIGNQIHFVLNTDLGFNKDAIVTIHTGYNQPENQVGVFVNKLKQIPGIASVTMHQQTPAATRHSATIINYKGAGGAKIDASFDICDENYVPLFGLKVIAGRNLLHADTIKEFLVNETCARALGFKNSQDALGKVVEIGINNAKGPIVGVVKDFHAESMHATILPFFMASLKGKERAISIKLLTAGKQAANFTNTIKQVENAWKQVYPDDRFEYRFFDETIASLYDKEQKTAQLMTVAMTIAIFISCMGLFGLATFTAQQRLKEIGIRKVLGASTAGIVAMLSKDFLALVVIAMLIASPVGYYFMHLWLQDFAYRVNISWWIFLLSGAAAITIALLTISVQSVKAAIANPVKSLRSE